MTCFLTQKTKKEGVYSTRFACCKHVFSIPQAKIPKRKSSTSINNEAKKISLENITGIDGRLESMERYEKASQTDKYFEDETPQYFFLLEQIAVT